MIRSAVCEHHPTTTCGCSIIHLIIHLNIWIQSNHGLTPGSQQLHLVTHLVEMLQLCGLCQNLHQKLQLCYACQMLRNELFTAGNTSSKVSTVLARQLDPAKVLCKAHTHMHRSPGFAQVTWPCCALHTLEELENLQCVRRWS